MIPACFEVYLKKIPENYLMVALIVFEYEPLVV